jgi:hypothetical protein
VSLDDVYRDRYFSPGYVYIAGSLAGCLLKIGTTKDVWRQDYRLRYVRYGNLKDWRVLCYVWVSEGGKVPSRFVLEFDVAQSPAA